MIRNTKDITQIIEKSELYILKYDKYVDRSTLKAFKVLKENLEDIDAYNAYVSNISEINRKLRYRLGYLEPNLLMMYSSSSLVDRFLIRALYELLAIYIVVLLYASINLEPVKTVLLALNIVIILIFTVDIIISLCILCVKKVIKFIKSKRKKK